MEEGLRLREGLLAASPHHAQASVPMMLQMSDALFELEVVGVVFRAIEYPQVRAGTLLAPLCN